VTATTRHAHYTAADTVERDEAAAAAAAATVGASVIIYTNARATLDGRPTDIPATG